jgi:hypothetical protein
MFSEKKIVQVRSVAVWQLNISIITSISPKFVPVYSILADVVPFPLDREISLIMNLTSIAPFTTIML